MSEINYQALREAAQNAKNLGGIKNYKRGEQAVAEFKSLITPHIVLALLEERERNQQYIKRRDQENEDIALTVGRLRVELEGKDSKIANLTAERDALREGEMGDARHSNTRAAADIYFQLVEECEIPAGGSLVEYVDDMREKLEAAEKRIAELEMLAFNPALLDLISERQRQRAVRVGHRSMTTPIKTVSWQMLQLAMRLAHTIKASQRQRIGRGLLIGGSNLGRVVTF